MFINLAAIFAQISGFCPDDRESDVYTPIIEGMSMPLHLPPIGPIYYHKIANKTVRYPQRAVQQPPGISIQSVIML